MKVILRVLLCLALGVMVDCSPLGFTSESSQTAFFEDTNPPDIGEVGVTKTIEWSRQRVRAAEAHFHERDQKRLGSPDFWGAETVYQIVVDRFNDGDPRNNFSLVGDEQRNAEQTRYRNLPVYHHGGDLKGITQRLDYLVDLGITALWLTPVLTNANGDYHGYCTTDFTQVDPNYGTKQDLVDLVREAHQRKIKVILDVVVNHMCDRQTRYASEHTRSEHTACAQDLAQENERSLPTHSPGQKEFHFSSSFFPPLRHQAFFNRCGGNTQAEMEGSGPTSLFGDFTSEMLDFDTRNYDFQEIFTNLLKYWVAYADIDGFRLDAVKHVTPDFTAYVSTMLRDYGHHLGKKHFYVVSEIAGDSSMIAHHVGKMNLPHNSKSLIDRLAAPATSERPESLANVAKKLDSFPFPGSTAVYDFAHSGIARDVLLLKRPSEVLEHYFTQDGYYRDLYTQGDPRLNFKLLEIHDWNRFNADYPHDQARSKLGLEYLALAPGIPVIYYGMEQGFNGQCRDGSLNPHVDQDALEAYCDLPEGADRHPLYRQDMFQGGMFNLGSTVPAIDQLAYIGPPSSPFQGAWQQDPFLNTKHDVYQSTRRMLHLRSSCYPLLYGDIVWRWSSSIKGGLFSFSRRDYGREVLVIVNPGRTAATIPDLQVDLNGVEYVNVEHPQVIARPGAEYRVHFGSWSLPPASLAVFVPRHNLGPWSAKYQVHTCLDISQARVVPEP